MTQIAIKSMTNAELKRKLEEARLSPNAYSLDGGLPNERYVLNQQPNGVWETYYSERGQKSNFRCFGSEAAACDSFLSQILKE